jgi:hypothetical protein
MTIGAADVALDGNEEQRLFLSGPRSAALAVALVQTNDFHAPVSVIFGEFQRYLKLAAMHLITKLL